MAKFDAKWCDTYPLRAAQEIERQAHEIERLEATLLRVTEALARSVNKQVSDQQTQEK